jgi:predicted dehydrogenase
MAKHAHESNTSRREFLTTTATAVGTAALAANLAAVANVHAQGNDLIKVGMIGCGGRGTGAAEQCVNAGPNVKLWAMGDTFQDRLNGAYNQLTRNDHMRARVDVPAARKFVGLNAYQQVIGSGVDLVILATPPGFRPLHLEAAVNANKHVFTEKPVAVDGPGVRRCLATFNQANLSNLNIVAGTQRRYQTGYLQSMQRIHNGDLGTLTSARCYWNQGSLWNFVRPAQMSDLEYQIRNWLYFTWLSGDHICEQHVHNLDVINWATRAHPTKAMGAGGRQVRTGAEFGHIYDHFAIEYEYPNGLVLTSFCRQQENCANNVSEEVTGTQGKWTSAGSPSSPTAYRINGVHPWTRPGNQDNQPYQVEHNRLIQAIRSGQRINDLRNVAESTLTAIMGRMAAYTGQVVTWEQALNSQENLTPQNLTFQAQIPVPPVAMPGVTELQ